MNKADKAESLFRTGYNCSQSVYAAFAEELGITVEEAAKKASPFGAGFGKLREVCGAVTGMVMVIGDLYGYDDPKDAAGKKKLYALVQKLCGAFEESEGSLICRELLGLEKGEDLEEPAVRTEEYYQSRPCVKACRRAAEILEEYVKEQKKMSEYITTYTGKHFKPTEPDPELFDIADIAHALSLICRGNGHVKMFWSVGEHCICCAKEAKARGLSDRMVLACLLHDASECYMSDVPSPFKKELPEYNEREERMLSMIYEKFLGSDLTPEEKMQLNAIDKAMLWYDLTFLLGEKQESEAPELHIDLRYEVRAFGEVEEEYRRIFEEQLITVQNKRI